jgi:hypothetical protein
MQATGLAVVSDLFVLIQTQLTDGISDGIF